MMRGKKQTQVGTAATCRPPLGPQDLSEDLARQGDAELGRHGPGPEAQLSLLPPKEHLPSYYTA